MNLRRRDIMAQSSVPVPTVDYLCFTAEANNIVVGMSENSGSWPWAPQLNLEYSIDGNTWHIFQVGVTQITLASLGDKVYFRGTNNCTAKNDNNYNRFWTSGLASVSGDVTTILNPQGNVQTFTQTFCLACLFSANTNLISANNLYLPTKQLTQYCYSRMFYYCFNLKQPPQIYATYLPGYCCRQMFMNCALKLSQYQYDDYQIPYRIPANSDDTALIESNWGNDMLMGTWGDATWMRANVTYYRAW